MPKPIEQFQAPDERLLNTVTKHDRQAGILYLGRYQDLYEHIEHLTLGDHIPDKVRAQWDLALNLYLHHWYVYEFATLAEQQAYAALETAMKCRFQAETGNTEAKMMLGNLIEYAIAHKWLNAADFEYPAAWAPSQKLSELDMLRRMRNDLAHGTFHLGVGGSFSALETCHQIIGELYPAKQPNPD